jgi:hypothetical protein
MVAQVIYGLRSKSGLVSRLWAAIASFLLVVAETNARNGDPAPFGL